MLTTVSHFFRRIQIPDLRIGNHVIKIFTLQKINLMTIKTYIIILDCVGTNHDHSILDMINVLGKKRTS